MQRGFFIGSLMALVCLAGGLVASAEEDTNIVAAAQVDENAGWESVFTSSNQIPFHINLYVKKGLYYELVESSDYQGSFYTSIFSEKRRLTGRLGAKVSMDGALYYQDGNLPEASSGFSLRKVRLNTYGRAFFLSPLTYGLEFGLSDGSFFFNDGYIWFHEVPYIRSFKFGVFTSPMSMESLQSSSIIPMMEKASPVTAFAPGDKLGIQLGGAILNKRGTLYGGIFSDAVSTENADSLKGARLMARATWLPVGSATSNGVPRQLHFGASSSYLRSSGEGVQFRSRPESYQAPYLIDTGKLFGNHSFIAALEGASQTGPLLIQSEVFYVNADDAVNDTHQFWGSYINAGLMLTGERRAYNRNAGVFTGIKPMRKFSFSERTWGALEWASRLSYTDLSDGTIQGGTMGILSTGINCYLSERNRIMVDMGAARVRDAVNEAAVLSEGSIYFLQTRFQMEF